MLIAEEFLLLTMNDKGISSVTNRETGTAGALLSELAGQERVMVDERGRLQVVDASSTGDAILDEALVRIGDRQGKKPQSVLGPLGKGMNKVLLERLAVAEIVEADRNEALGVSLFTTWPFVDTAHRDALRQDLLRVLSAQAEPDLRTGTLISLLQANSAWSTALPKDARGGLKGGDIKRSAKEIAKGRWGSEAVRKAVEAANAALFVAVYS
ncbi:GOLPH3/VPS74 family protein [Ornithinimicrobium panacihumi]|uniref:GOLPH3/VPS74 family protein n=1 Tax=Ornithinimicrobium panacihumi TaxID=2008449 RepID=UPI003F8CE3D3